MGDVTRARAGRTLRAALAGITTTALVAGALVIAGGTAASAAVLPTPAPMEQRGPSTVTAEVLPTVQIDSGVVWTQVIKGDTVYAGGSFTNARPAGAAPGSSLMPRSNILAYDINTGAATSFAPVINGTVKALTLSPDGTRLYVGGSFTQVDGQTRFNIAAFDTATGALLSSFKPAVGGSYVNAIVATSSTVYVGGLIGAVGGTMRKNLAAVTTDGALLAWAPTTDLQVDSMVLNASGSKLVVAGRFGAVNDASNPGFAALDPTSGTVVPYQATSTIRSGTSGAGAGKSGIFSLTTDSTGAVLGTSWNAYGTSAGNLEGSFSIEGETGALTWISDCHGDHYGIYSDGTTVYTTGHMHDCATAGGFPQVNPAPGNLRHSTAYTAAAKGTLRESYGPYVNWAGYPAPAPIDWYPEWTTGTATGQGQAGWTMTGNGKYLLVGGEFPLVNGKRSQGIARFGTPSAGGTSEGPRLTDADWKPSATSSTAGVVSIQVPANWDRDDLTLTYELWESGGVRPIATRTASSTFWERTRLSFTLRDQPAGATRTFHAVARDGDGNSARSADATVTVGGTAASRYVAKVIDDEPSHYWRQGQSAAAGGKDLVGGNDLVYSSGAPTTSAGIPGADDGYLSSRDARAATRDTVNPTGTFAVEVWFRTASAGGKLIGFGNLAQGSSTIYDDHLYMKANGQLVFGAFPNRVATIQSPGALNDNVWHHAVGQVSPTKGMELFVDGVLVASDPTVTTSNAYTGYWRIGSDSVGGWPDAPPSGAFFGSLDEIAVYPRALTAAQVSEHFALGSGVSPQVTAAYTVSGSELSWTFANSGRSTVTITGRSWDFGDGTTGSGTPVTHVYEKPGTYTVRGTWTDSRGYSWSTLKTVTATEAYKAPTAAFTTNQSDLTVIADGRTSAAYGASITSYAWSFGDGTTGSGATATHDYAASGTYEITLTVTDDRGTTAVVTKTVTVTAPAQKVYAARDDFERSVSTGWGDAPLGGTWSGTTGFAVSGGVGTATLAAGQTRSSALSASAARDVDASVVLSADKVATGTGLHINLVVRKTNAGEYRLKVRTLPTGAVTASLTKLVGAVETTLATKTLQGYTYTAGAKLRLRLTATTEGAGTALAAKVWPDGTTEPTSTLLAATDGEAALQTAGRAGVLTYLTTTATNAPVTVSVDDFAVVNTATHANPTASFTASATGLALAVDGSGSAATDGATLTSTWNWGDGTANGSGTTATHAYAAAGTYTVTLSLSDSLGGTATTSQQVTVTAPVVTDVIAADDFERSAASGWGTAVTGGAWGTAAGFSVADGAGRLVLSPGQTRSTFLTAVNAQNVDARLTIATDKVADGGGQHVNYVVHKTTAGDYRLKLRISATGAVQVAVAKVAGTTETILVNKTLTGYTHTAGAKLRLRLQAVTDGTGTTLNGKVWSDGTAEPGNWFVTASDTQAELQGAGQVGVLSYLSGSATNAPVTLSVDDLDVR